jgi:hypothetical protein
MGYLLSRTRKGTPGTNGTMNTAWLTLVTIAVLLACPIGLAQPVLPVTSTPDMSARCAQLASLKFDVSRVASTEVLQGTFTAPYGEKFDGLPGFWLIALGVLITTSQNLMSYAYHAYQPELFPTHVRARAVGFVYSFSRLSTIFTGFMIAFFLNHFGTRGVFGFIAFSMGVLVISIGCFGPRTRALALEEIHRGEVL